jgi:hypothetical protein
MIIGNDGSLRMIYDDDVVKAFEEIARVTVRRASHVEPVEIISSDSIVYRAPGVRWQADMRPVGGPILFPFLTRQAALDAERAWLLDHDIPFPKEG